jgi:hypothetical protein
MKDERLLDDDDLKAAFRSVRDAYDGTHEEANLALQRALFHTRTRGRRQRLTRWVVLPIAAVLAASTAWAGVTGKLTPALHSVLDSFHAEHAPPRPPANLPSHAANTPASDPSAMASTVTPPASNELATSSPPPSSSASDVPSEVPPSIAPSAAPIATAPPTVASVSTSPSVAHGSPSPSSAAQQAPSHTTEPSAGKEAIAPAPSASAADPHATLFAEAHRLHFIERDPARALAAWERYIAVAPNGRFSPEARYNRALALVRLGRTTEARRELEPFANGTYGSYRRDEARALLDALARDASSP